MALDDVRDKIEKCRLHLENVDDSGTVVEELLKKSLLIEMCGECEKDVHNTIVQRAKRSDDRELEEFVEVTVRMQRHLRLGDMGSMLARFNAKREKNFLASVSDKDKQEYRAMITNRNSGAHGGAINVTLDELCRYHENACRVTAAFSDAMVQDP